MEFTRFLKTLTYHRRLRLSWKRHYYLKYHHPLKVNALIWCNTYKKPVIHKKFYSTYIAVSEHTIGKPEKELLDPVQVLENFSQVAEGGDFSDITFHPVVQDCMRVVRGLNKEQLSKLIDILMKISKKFPDLYKNDDNMSSIGTYLDNYFVTLLYEFELEHEKILELLKRAVVLPKNSDFHTYLVKRFKKVYKWPTPLMLEYVQYLNRNYLWTIYYVNKYGVEEALSRRLSGMDVNQVAVMLEALIALHIYVNTPDLANQLLRLFMEQYASATPSSILVWTKFFTNLEPCFWNSSLDTSNEVLRKLSRIFTENIETWEFHALVYATSFFRKIMCYDRVFLKKLAQRMLLDDALRSNPNVIDELVLSMVYFNAEGDYTEELKCLLEKMKVDPLRSIMRSHPKRLISVVNNLSKVGIYDDYFLELMLSDGFLRDTYKKVKIYAVSVNFYSLDQNAIADCPNYQGRRLNEDLKRGFDKIWFASLPELLTLESTIDNNYEKFSKKTNAHTRFLFDLKNILQEILGEGCVHACFMHRHIPRGNLVFALNDKKVPKKIEERFRSNARFMPEMLDAEHNWYSFKFLSRNSLPPHEPLLLYNGINSARLLTKMGFNLIPIIAMDWRQLNHNEKVQHLKKLIFYES